MSFLRFQQGLRLGMSPQVADSMRYVYGGGSGEQKTESENNQTPYQQGQFDTLLQGANKWLSTGGFDRNYGGSKDFDSVANQNANQNAANQGTVQNGQNLQGILNGAGQDSLKDYLGAYDPNKTGLTGAINASNNALDWNYSTQVNPMIRQGATDAGQFGSTRHGVAEGIAQAQLGQQKTNAASTMAFQDQQQYNQNRLGALNNMGNIANGLNAGNALQGSVGDKEQQQAQNEINGQLEAWAYKNNVSLNDLTAYKALISGNMGGSATASGTSSGGGSGGAGALASIGGSALGSYMGSS